MYLLSDLTILTIHISLCFCYVNYNIFQGFDVPLRRIRNTTNSSPGPLTAVIHGLIDEEGLTTVSQKHSATSKIFAIPTTLPSPLSPVKTSMFNCTENEKPFNIGTYEVPTQLDLVLFIQKTLIRMFNTYQAKALYFLKDIQEATKATSAVERKCHSRGRNPTAYKTCVKRVSNKCAGITKNLVTSLEMQRSDVSAFMEGTICNVTEMKADPVQLIKTLAMEEASLEFAMPGFLRLLGACSIYCDKFYSTEKQRKPLRSMTNLDLVVKHFLTRKNYLQLIKGAK